MAVELENLQNYDFSDILKDTVEFGDYHDAPNGWEPMTFEGKADGKASPDSKFHEIGNWAVNEHNKQAHTQLKFEKVIKGWTKSKSGGTVYLLILKAKDNNVSHKYSATVFKIGMIMKLVNFFQVPFTKNGKSDEE